MDLSGKKFGTWTIVSPIKKGNRIYWHCKCDCGTERDVLQYSLTSGKSTGCGHDTKKGKIFKDLTGQKFGELTVLEKTEQRDQGSIVWKCQCSCGNIVYWPGDRLQQTKTPNCGCLKSLIGEKFGKLTVIAECGRSKNRDIVWECECECGTHIFTTTHNLRDKRTIGCGCSSSIGEYNIAKCLSDNNISFKKEFAFSDLKDSYCLRYDFAIFNKDNILIRLIQFDGNQHYEKTNNFYSNTIVKHDIMKNDYAKQHNIPLVRIPYSQRDCISLDIILGDTYLI